MLLKLPEDVLITDFRDSTLVPAALHPRKSAGICKQNSPLGCRKDEKPEAFSGKI
jgi:hypothetical protein